MITNIGKNIYTKILGNTEYKPYFRIELKYCGSETLKIIKGRNFKKVEAVKEMICELLDISADILKDLLIITSTDTPEKTAGNDIIIYTFDFVVKGYKIFPVYIKDWIEYKIATDKEFAKNSLIKDKELLIN